MSQITQLLKQHRRNLHTYPETAWTEFQTTWYIYQQLMTLPFKLRLGKEILNEAFVLNRDEEEVKSSTKRALNNGVPKEFIHILDEFTGVMATFETHKSGPTFVLRFDIDALPIQETEDAQHLPNLLGFRSRHDNCMHACGHDFHTAIGLVLARWISEQRAKLRGKIILLFQPAEEGSRGARAVSASGLLDEADYFAAAHVGMMARTGEVVIDPYGFLCGTKFNVDFKGRAAHCASEPEAGKNALAAACSAFMLLQGISRSSKGASRINVGKLSGGRGRNIIPDQAYMEIDLRGETTEVNDYLVKRTQEILKGTAQSLDVQLSIEDLGTVYDINNDPELVEYLKEVASQCPLVKAVTTHSDFGGSEDASIIIKRIQQLFGKCIYFVIGADRTAGHHQPDFDADEAALEIGFEMFKGLIRKINGC
ncbi:amidohydrolase [Parasutterella excrementihominis]|uniref:amidohydrolase n=1 Tax=Parasutterella excrementihominis TaxID=487175 RepID=UPI002431E19B|nr:amidohydrolase [Parasutterella excrementihominis]